MNVLQKSQIRRFEIRDIPKSGRLANQLFSHVCYEKITVKIKEIAQQKIYYISKSFKRKLILEMSEYRHRN